MDPRSEATTLHANCVALGPNGLLILGSSGSGKSALSLELMALGARLVADDRTVIEMSEDALVARCPPAIRGRIEANGVGILAADSQPSARVRLVVDLDRAEDQRLPPRRTIVLQGVTIPLLHSSVHGHFPAAILQYLKGGRSD